MVQIIFSGLMIPFAGTALGAALVLFMKKELGGSTTKILSGFAAGVMVAAYVLNDLSKKILAEDPSGRSPCQTGLFSINDTPFPGTVRRSS